MLKIISNKKGFSLVELIVVISILVVISAIAIPAVLNTLNGLKIKVDVSTAQAISKSVNLAVVNANSDTSTANDIAIVPADGVTLSGLSDTLQAELVKLYPDITTTKTQNSGGDFTVKITSVNPYAGNVSFSAGTKTYTIDQNGKVAIN